MSRPTISSSQSGPFHFKHLLVLRATEQLHKAGRQRVICIYRASFVKAEGKTPKQLHALCSHRFAYNCCNSTLVGLLLLCSCVARGKRLTAGWSWCPQGPRCSRSGGGGTPGSPAQNGAAPPPGSLGYTGHVQPQRSRLPRTFLAQTAVSF